MTAQIVTDVMNEWRAGIDAHDSGRVAAAFAFDEREDLELFIGVVLTRTADHWR
jgi:hypothetical protein